MSANNLPLIMYWSLVPAILVMPLWMAMGRLLLGGPVGWMGVFYFFVVSPIVLIYHGMLYWAWHWHRKSGTVDPTSAYVLLAYYIFCFSHQLFMRDGGDRGTEGSVAQNYLGVPMNLCDLIADGLLILIIIVMVSLLVLVFCNLPTSIDKMCNETNALTGRGDM